MRAIGVAAPEGSAGGEDPRSRRAAVRQIFSPSPCRARRQWRWEDAAIAQFFFFAVAPRGVRGPCNELTLRALDLIFFKKKKHTHTRQTSGERGVTHIAEVHARAHDVHV